MSDHDGLARDVAAAALKAAPPVAGYAFTLNDWVAVATIVYLAVQIAHLVWKWRKEARAHLEAAR